VRRLEEEIAVLREERDATIARELLTMAHEQADAVLA